MASSSVPKITTPDGLTRIVLAVDVSNWLRPDAATNPARAFCHTYVRGRGQADMSPGWPFSFVAAVETGAASWTALLDVVRLHPDDAATVVTAAQVRTVVDSLCRAGHYHPADPDILVVADAGSDVVWLAWLLDDLPGIILVGSALIECSLSRLANARAPPKVARRHGQRLALRDAATQTDPMITTTTQTIRYGRAQTVADAGMHPKIDPRAGWKHYQATMDQPPIIEGTIIGLFVERVPGDRHPKPVWLWASKPIPEDDHEVDHWWAMFIR